MPKEGYEAQTLDTDTMQILEQMKTQLGMKTRSELIRALVRGRYKVFPELKETFKKDQEVSATTPAKLNGEAFGKKNPLQLILTSYNNHPVIIIKKIHGGTK